MNNIKKLEHKEHSAINVPFSARIKSLTYDQPIHWHSYYEIEYIVSGTGEYILNGTTYEIEKNLMFFSSPSDFQEIHFSSETTIINIQFSPELVNSELYKNLSGPIIIKDTDSFYQHMLRSLCSYGPKSSNHNQSFIINMLNSFLFLICSNKKALAVKKHDEINSHFHKALLYINAHFQEEISLSDLSREIHLRSEYISRLFKKNSNQTFNEYLTDVRLSHAYKLLEISDAPVFDIAMQSGYTSFPHFIRMFKRKYGYPPTKIRKISKNSEK